MAARRRPDVARPGAAAAAWAAQKGCHGRGPAGGSQLASLCRRYSAGEGSCCSCSTDRPPPMSWAPAPAPAGTWQTAPATALRSGGRRGAASAAQVSVALSFPGCSVPE